MARQSASKTKSGMLSLPYFPNRTPEEGDKKK
jgi:hypothetical protein